MSKQAGKLARRYSRAFLRAIEQELGSEGRPTPAQEIANSLSGLSDVWQKEDALQSAILNPMFDKTERAAALEQVARIGNVSDIVLRFLKLVFERDRIAILPEIAESFSKLANEAASVVKVEVTVAREIAGDESGQIEQSLSQHIAGSLEFDWRVDPEILGGMLVKYQGKVLDGSLQGRIQRIEKRLMS